MRSLPSVEPVFPQNRHIPENLFFSFVKYSDMFLKPLMITKISYSGRKDTIIIKQTGNFAKESQFR